MPSLGTLLSVGRFLLPHFKLGMDGWIPNEIPMFDTVLCRLQAAMDTDSIRRIVHLLYKILIGKFVWRINFYKYK